MKNTKNISKKDIIRKLLKLNKNELLALLTTFKPNTSNIGKYVVLFPLDPNYKGTDHWLVTGNHSQIVCNINNATTFKTIKQAKKAIKNLPETLKNTNGFLPPQIQPINDLPADF